MIGIFKVGDIIKGNKNEYGITNDEMLKAKVTDVSDDRMEVKILEHKRESEINERYWVDNNDEYFSFFNVEITEELLLDLPIGTKLVTDDEEHNYFIKITDNEFENDDSDILTIKEDDFSKSDFDFKKNEIDLYGNRYKIIRIEKPIYHTIYEEEQQPKEMTIKEISKILGYDIKIVKEK